MKISRENYLEIKEHLPAIAERMKRNAVTPLDKETMLKWYHVVQTSRIIQGSNSCTICLLNSIKATIDMVMEFNKQFQYEAWQEVLNMQSHLVKDDQGVASITLDEVGNIKSAQKINENDGRIGQNISGDESGHDKSKPENGKYEIRNATHGTLLDEVNENKKKGKKGRSGSISINVKQ